MSDFFNIILDLNGSMEKVYHALVSIKVAERSFTNPEISIYK